MKVLLDTNVWIAGFIARGTSSDLIEHLEHNHQVVTSEWLVDELAEVLTRKFDYSSSRVSQVTEFVQSSTRCIVLSGEPPEVSKDPDDNYVLLTARQTNADIIVSGDRDLLSLDTFEGIKIIQPDQFWKYENLQ